MTKEEFKKLKVGDPVWIICFEAYEKGVVKVIDESVYIAPESLNGQILKYTMSFCMSKVYTTEKDVIGVILEHLFLKKNRREELEERLKNL